MAEFVFEEFAKDFPEGVASVLASEGYNSLRALLCAERTDISELKLKKGHIGIVRSAIQDLQTQHKTGPMFRGTCEAGSAESETEVSKLCQLLGGLTTNNGSTSSKEKTAKGQCFHIVDFIPATMINEEEVTLGGSVILKVNAKPKLEKVSPGMWISANVKILQKLMEDDDFDVMAYLRYTAMIGELATRFTWASVLLFDDEYRKRQAENKFVWGTDAPHLSTVLLRERPPQPKAGKQGGNQAARPQATGGPGATCRQFNRGACTYGATCKYEHVCSVCGGLHASKDHGTAGGPSATQFQQ